MHSISQRIFVSLAITTVVTSLCAYGWIYWEAKLTENVLRQRALFDQASLLSSYLTSIEGRPALQMPQQLSEAFQSSVGNHRFSVRSETGDLLLTSGRSTRPLPIFHQSTHTAYDYDPDGPGPRHMFGAAVRTNVGGRYFVIQVEEDGLDSQYLREAVNQEFLIDGGWLQVPFLIAWLVVNIFAIRRALAPLNEVSRVAGMIDPTTADIRLPARSVPREILPLVNAINLALDRLAQGLMRQREFNANAAHQLRTPLAVLSANIEAMKDNDIAPKLKYDVDVMTRIVNQLLLMARLETTLDSDKEMVDLGGIVTDVAINLGPLAIASGKQLDVINERGPVLVHANVDALRAAVSNLVENALTHTKPDTAVTIRVTQEPAIEIADCGPGVPPERRAQVFERFWTGDRNGKGAGLGLAIVKRIMTAMQGSVSVSSDPRGGATFTLHFSAKSP